MEFSKLRISNKYATSNENVLRQNVCYGVYRNAVIMHTSVRIW